MTWVVSSEVSKRARFLPAADADAAVLFPLPCL